VAAAVAAGLLLHLVETKLRVRRHETLSIIVRCPVLDRWTGRKLSNKQEISKW